VCWAQFPWSRVCLFGRRHRINPRGTTARSCDVDDVCTRQGTWKSRLCSSPWMGRRNVSAMRPLWRCRLSCPRERRLAYVPGLPGRVIVPMLDAAKVRVVVGTAECSPGNRGFGARSRRSSSTGGCNHPTPSFQRAGQRPAGRFRCTAALPRPATAQPGKPAPALVLAARRPGSRQRQVRPWAGSEDVSASANSRDVADRLRQFGSGQALMQTTTLRWRSLSPSSSQVLSCAGSASATVLVIGSTGKGCARIHATRCTGDEHAPDIGPEPRPTAAMPDQVAARRADATSNRIYAGYCVGQRENHAIRQNAPPRTQNRRRFYTPAREWSRLPNPPEVAQPL